MISTLKSINAKGIVNGKFVPFFLALSLTISLAIALPICVSHLNFAMFGSVNILSKPLNISSVISFYWFLGTGLFPGALFLFWRLTSGRNKKNDSAAIPSSANSVSLKNQCVSVIVPAYNEEKNVGKCIEAILSQDFKGEIEVIVINDGSTDGTSRIASQYPVKIVDLKKNCGKSKALNEGIKIAKGEILIFSDADSQIASNAVGLLAEYLEKNKNIDGVAGTVLIHTAQSKRSLLKSFQTIECSIEQEVNRFLNSLNATVFMCPGSLFAVRKQVTDKVIFSDKSVVEDADFTIEVLKKSMKITREPNAKVYTNPHTSLGSWYRQRKRWWYGYLQLWKIHRKWAIKKPLMVLNYLSFVASLFSLGLLLSLPFLFSAYGNFGMILLRTVFYCTAPMILFATFYAPALLGAKKLIPLLIPYSIIYLTIKFLILSYLYISYILRRGVSVKFGPRIVKIK